MMLESMMLLVMLAYHMTQDQGISLLEPHFEWLADIMTRATRTYHHDYSRKGVHRPTTAANVIADEIWAEIISGVDQNASFRIVPQSQGLRVLGVLGRNGDVEALLWFKKVSDHRKPSNVATERAKSMHAGEPLELFDYKAPVLVIGYEPSRENAEELKCLSISKPRKGKTPEWFVDLELPRGDSKPTIIPINPQGSPPIPSAIPRRVTVRKTKQLEISG